MKRPNLMRPILVVSFVGAVAAGCTQQNPNYKPVDGSLGDSGNTCFYKGKVYDDQATFKDDCNSCKCNSNGLRGVACTEKACRSDARVSDSRIVDAKVTHDAQILFCIYKGSQYNVGSGFSDACNTCQCNTNGSVTCTKRFCSDTGVNVSDTTLVRVDSDVVVKDAVVTKPDSSTSADLLIKKDALINYCLVNGVKVPVGESYRQKCSICGCVMQDGPHLICSAAPCAIDYDAAIKSK